MSAPSEFPSRRTFLTVSTALGLTGLSGLYSWLVDPLIQPPSVAAGPGPGGPVTVAPPEESRNIAKRWLPSQPWAADAPYQLRNNEAYVYFEEWERLEKDRAVRFQPFAIVWKPKDRQSDKEPLRIVSSSAYLRFGSPFRLDSDPGRIIFAALEGDVQIVGDDGLDVVGKNFFFSEEANRVWSDNHVRFRHGPNRGHALRLQADLIRDDRKKDESVAVSGVKVVRLGRNVSMDLYLDEDLPALPSAGSRDSSRPHEPTPVSIRSAGSFTFDLQEHIATYEEDVRVFRPTGDGQYDSLHCDLLTLLFQPEEDSQAATNAEGTGSAAGDADPDGADEQPTDSGRKPDESRIRGLGGNLAFRRLKAEGEQVVLYSQANDMQAWMNELVYDQQTRVAALTSQKTVRVLNGDSELNAPEITLVHDDEGTVHSAWCRGAGWLKYYEPESGAVELHAQWQKQLRKYPDPDSSLEIVELEEKAVVRQPLEQTGLAAELITLWLQQRDQNERAPSAAREAADGATFDASRVRLDRMLAVENVAMITPDMEAETKRLEVFFQPADLPPRTEASVIGTSGPLPRKQAGLRPADKHVGRRFRRPLNRPSHAEPGGRPAAARIGQALASRPPEVPHAVVSSHRSEAGESGGGHLQQADRTPAPAPAETERPREPFLVSADRVRARVLHDQKRNRSQVAEIWTYGNVRIRQKQAGDEPPLEVLGDHLHLQNRSERDQTLHIYAKPDGDRAHIRDGDIHIAGRKLHLNTGKNLARVEGAGLLQNLVRRTLEGEPLNPPQLLNVTWSEKMEFDGLTATFYGEVQAALAESRMRCQQMEVVLTEKLLFSEADREGQAPDIRSVICKEGVDVESRVHQQGDLTELRRARFWDFRLDHETGETRASGPGWLAFWQQTEGNRAGLAPVATATANKPLRSETTGWKYTRIDFAERIEGNTHEQLTTFFDRVRIVYGPVKGSGETIDPDDLPKDGGWMRCRKLRLTQHDFEDRKGSYVKALARGNVSLKVHTYHGEEGQRFNARADEITYDESKGLYVLRSFGNRTATLWRQKSAGGTFSGHDSQRMEFIPARRLLLFDKAVGGVGVE